MRSLLDTLILWALCSASASIAIGLIFRPHPFILLPVSLCAGAAMAGFLRAAGRG